MWTEEPGTVREWHGVMTSLDRRPRPPNYCAYFQYPVATERGAQGKGPRVKSSPIAGAFSCDVVARSQNLGSAYEPHLLVSAGSGPVRAATEQGRADTVDGRGPGLFADSKEDGSQRSSADHNRVLVRAATRVGTDRSDDDLRSMILLKEEALAAWMMGAIMLQSPPGFLVCTHPRATRVVMLDFFEEYLEWKVIAIVPPYVRMPQYIAEKTLLLQLLERSEGQTESDVMSRELAKGAKRTSYDAETRRMTFVMPDQAAAASWHAKMIFFRGKRLQLLCPATMEHEDITAPSLLATSSGRNQLQYQVRSLVNGVAASTVQPILASSVACTVTSVSRGCPLGSEAYDSHFFVATFDMVSCPEQLKLCGGRKGAFKFSITENLLHVSGLADTLVATTAKLKADGNKAPLLSEVSQVPPCAGQSSVPNTSPLAGGQAVRGGATRASGPMTNEWFDPGANKKKRDMRPADVPASRATGPAVKLPKHPQFNKDGGARKSPLPKSKAVAQTISTNTVADKKKPPQQTKATVRQKGQSTTVHSSPPPSASSKADTQRTLAIWELDHILSGAHEEVAEPAPIDPGQPHKKTVEELNLAAEEKQRAADTTKSCYFAAHAQALEVAIATEKTSNREPTSPEEISEELMRMEYEYRTAGATANRANADATITAKTLERLTRQLAKITPKPKPVTEDTAPQEDRPPREMPTEMAERCRERSRSMIQRLSASYVRRKRGVPSEPIDKPLGTVPTAKEPRDPGPPDLPPMCPPESDGKLPQDLDVTMAESTVTFGNTMCLNDLNGGAVTPPIFAASVPVPADLAKAIEEELKASSKVIDVSDTGASSLLTRPTASMGGLCTQVAVRSPMEQRRAPDPHDQTLRATRIRKIPDSASAAVAAAAVPESMKQISLNTAAIRKWVSLHKAMAALPTTMPVGPKGQMAWINACSLDLAGLVCGLPYPVAYLASMSGETLRSLGHSINSESQLAVIQEHTTHADEELRELCKGWAATADAQTGHIRWRTTDDIQRWRRFSKLQPDLLCATVVEPLSDLDQWGVLNVLCLLLPKLALIEVKTNVVMPQTKAVLYHLSKEVCAAVISIISTPSNWQPALDLIAQDSQLLDSRC
uniref:Uncharacterized protein n=1 Tax=Peronospora matthiolae TaxID=2874970 RepID=A0AAV1U7U0_9STRA